MANITAKDIAYTIDINNIDINEVVHEWHQLILISPDTGTEYEYKGESKIRISSSVSVIIPFAISVVVEDVSEGMDTLYRNLLVQNKHRYPSLLDMHLDIKTVRKK